MNPTMPPPLMVQGNVSATVVDFTPFIHNEAWICGAFSLLELNSSRWAS
ncbi:hypothetical protein [Candidatus Coxiella mudrowiae]|nr:hypothetical protein [Candidatus Coxiella mudrowiae]